jgi:hypothetical protein
MKYCTVDETGLYTAFYDSEINTEIPEDAFEIPEKVWYEHIITQERPTYWNGKKFADLPERTSPSATWNGKRWVEDEETQWFEIRSRRDHLLSESDYVMTVDLYESLTEKKQKAWKKYRKTLRDIPQKHAKDPLKVKWPKKPA